MKSLRRSPESNLRTSCAAPKQATRRRKTTRVYPGGREAAPCPVFGLQSVFVFARSNKSREEKGNIGSDCFGENLLFLRHRDGAGQWNFG